MCERKAKKDVPAAVVSRAACVSRAPLADASRLGRLQQACLVSSRQPSFDHFGRLGQACLVSLRQPSFDHFDFDFRTAFLKAHLFS